MLVAGLGAGVALADEPEAARQTQSETMQQGSEGQQPATETGDVADETNTNADDQTDPSQGAYGDEGADVEPGDGDSEESDQTQESEADKADGDQPQNDADNGQSAEKQSAQVPAPQTANEAADGGVSAQAEGDGTDLTSESFAGSTLSDKWLLPDQGAVNSACLTGAPKGSKWYCDDSKSVYTQAYRTGQDGYGFLQLTDDVDSNPNKGPSNEKAQTGTVLYNEQIPIRYGLDVEFDQWQFHASNKSIEEGDGIGFFLIDGSYDLSIPVQAGEDFGGTLGYSAIQYDNGSKMSPGITAGVLGIGLDVYGNYSSTDGVGGSDTQGDHKDQKNMITVRGKGVADGDPSEAQTPEELAKLWTKGYPILKTANNDWGVSAEAYGSSLLTTSNPEMSEMAGHETTGSHVRIQITPADNQGNQTLTVTVTSKKYPIRSVTGTWNLTDLPDTVRFGFSASTGWACSTHFIRNLTFRSAVATPDITFTKEVNHDLANGGTARTTFTAGESVPYSFIVRNTGKRELTNIQVTDTTYSEMVNCDSTNLAVDEQMTCYASFTLTSEQANQAIENGGTFTNTAVVTADSVEQQQDTADIQVIESLGEPAHRKYITKKNGANDEYTLHLDVTGRSESSSSDTGTAADVVLVLDGSTSMRGSRLQQLKDAANGLVNKLLTDENSKLPEQQQIRVGVMWFSDKAEPQNFAVGWDTQYFTTDPKEARQAVSSGTADGNTYWDRALKAVKNNYSSDRDAARYVVFVTDGAPSSYGFEFNSDLYDNAVTSGKNIVQAGWNVVNVSVDLAEQIYVDPDAESLTEGSCQNGRYTLWCTVDYSSNANWGRSKKEQDWVNTVDGLTGHEKDAAQPGQTVEYVSASSGDLNDIFDDLAETITSTSEYEIVSISDTLSQWVEPVDWAETGDVTDYVTVSPAVSGYMATYDAITRTVKVTFPEGYRPANDTTVTVSFGIQPSANAYETYAGEPAYPDTGGKNTDDPMLDNNPAKWISTGKSGFRTNTEAQVIYREVVDGEAGTDKTAGYVSPVVTVRTGSIAVIKKWQPNKPDDTSSVTVDLYKVGVENPVASSDLSAEGDWSHTFANLVPGTYTVREQSEVPGYASSVTYENKLTADGDENITFTGDDLHNGSYDADKSFTVTVTNALETYSVPLLVEKNLIGRGWDESDSFTFLLTPIGENADMAPGPSDAQVHEFEGGWLLTVKASDFPHFGDVRMHEFMFDVPFSEEPYTYTIREVKPKDPELGMTYSKVEWKLTLYANTDPDTGYNFGPPELVDGSDDDSGERSETRGANRTVEFTNTYVAPVSSLPLTGGRSTARTLLLAGGGVLLVAGAAWLLARRRRV